MNTQKEATEKTVLCVQIISQSLRCNFYRSAAEQQPNNGKARCNRAEAELVCRLSKRHPRLWAIKLGFHQLSKTWSSNQPEPVMRKSCNVAKTGHFPRAYSTMSPVLMKPGCSPTNQKQCLSQVWLSSFASSTGNQVREKVPLWFFLWPHSSCSVSLCKLVKASELPSFLANSFSGTSSWLPCVYL